MMSVPRIAEGIQTNDIHGLRRHCVPTCSNQYPTLAVVLADSLVLHSILELSKKYAATAYLQRSMALRLEQSPGCDIDEYWKPDLDTPSRQPTTAAIGYDHFKHEPDNAS